MERFKRTHIEENYRRLGNELLKLVVVVLMLSTGCMAKFAVTVSSAEMYALNGQNTTFIYTITGEGVKKSDPDAVKVKIQVDKQTYAVLYQIILKKGNLIKKFMEGVGTNESLEHYKGRVSVEYKEPNLKLHLIDITDADFDWKYRVEVIDDDVFGRIQKDIKLIKAVKPKIIKASFFPSFMINRGSNDEFICRADGIPKATVKWVNKEDILNTGFGKATVSINNAQIKDTSNYDCIADNIGGIDKKTMSLTVAYIEYGTKNDQSTSKRISVVIGGKIEVQCDVGGYPEPEYKWKDPSEAVIRTSRDLIIGNINKEQLGNYTCEAANEAKTLNYIVQVEEKKELPKISDTAFFPRAMVQHGTNDEYVCRASGSPSPKVKWLTKSGIVNSHVLPLIDVQKNDAGDYTCVVENVVGVVNRTMTLTVSYIEYTQEGISSESVNITEGGQIDVLCKVAGIPTPSYKWLDPNGNVVRSSQQLNISNVTLTGRGKYKCEANNGADTVYYEVELNVEALPTRKPTSPTTVQVITSTEPTTNASTVQQSSKKPTPEPVPESTVAKVTSRRLSVVIEADSDPRKGAAATTVSILPCIIFLSVNSVYFLF